MNAFICRGIFTPRWSVITTASLRARSEEVSYVVFSSRAPVILLPVHAQQVLLLKTETIILFILLSGYVSLDMAWLIELVGPVIKNHQCDVTSSISVLYFQKRFSYFITYKISEQLSCQPV